MSQLEEQMTNYIYIYKPIYSKRDKNEEKCSQSIDALQKSIWRDPTNIDNIMSEIVQDMTESYES